MSISSSFFELDARLKRLMDAELAQIETRIAVDGFSLNTPVCRWSQNSQLAHLKGLIDGLRGIFDSPGICDLSKDDWFALAERYGAVLKATNRLLEGANALA